MMNTIRWVGILLIPAALVLGCAETKGPMRHVTADELREMSVADFFRALDNPEGMLVVHGQIEDWPPHQAIPDLVSLLDDPTPCRSVALVQSSHIETEPSTYGHEAAFLLMGIKLGRYPPALNSTRNTPESREEIRAWANRVGTDLR